MIENLDETISRSIGNRTGISENKKHVEEQPSELDLSVVLGVANDYTKGTDIIVGADKKDHQGHEPWHLGQQPED